MRIKLSIMVNKGRRIHDIVNYLEFDDVEDFADYKRKFYEDLMDRGWNRSYVSANQCYKGDLVLTPYFIRE